MQILARFRGSWSRIARAAGLGRRCYCEHCGAEEHKMTIGTASSERPSSLLTGCSPDFTRELAVDPWWAVCETRMACPTAR